MMSPAELQQQVTYDSKVYTHASPRGGEGSSRALAYVRECAQKGQKRRHDKRTRVADERESGHL